MEAKHSKTPWRIGNAGRGVFPAKSDNPCPKLIASFDKREDAELAVRTVNAHGALVAERDALRAACEGLVDLGERYDWVRGTVMCERLLAEARAALALWKGARA